MRNYRKAALAAFYYVDIFSRESRAFKKTMLRLDRTRRLASQSDTSAAGEFASIKSLLDDLGIAAGYCVDIAASDGVTQSSTLPLFKEGWRGLAVEMDPTKFATLATVYSGFSNAQLARVKVTPENAGQLLRSIGTPSDFDVLNLDIDSFDLYVMEALLVSNFRPKIVSMEINEKIPPPLWFSVEYRDGHVWSGDHFYGCSLTAAHQLLSSQGYGLVNLVFNNALFVDLQRWPGQATVDPKTAYDEGYREHPDRRSLFPWNNDVDIALELDSLSAELFFRDLFRTYDGQYRLTILSD